MDSLMNEISKEVQAKVFKFIWISKSKIHTVI